MDKLNLKHVPIKDRNVTKGLKYVVTTFFAQFPFHNKTLIGNVSYKVLPGDKVVVNIPYYASLRPDPRGGHYNAMVGSHLVPTRGVGRSPNGTPILKLTALGAAISK